VATPAHQLHRFLRAAHRRWIVWRVLERAAIGVLVACALTMILLPILAWRGERVMPMVLGSMLLGAVCGAIFGITSRPTVLDTAIESDRQLNLADLLATAISIRQRDEWSDAVIAMADARCAHLAPRQILFNRLGVRAWGGIGLSAAIVLTLAILSSNAVITQAIAQASGRAPQANASNPAAREEMLSVAREPSRVAHPAQPSDEDHSQIPSRAETHTKNSESTAANHNVTSTDGSGAGQANTEATNHAGMNPSASPANASNTRPSHTATGGGVGAPTKTGTDLAGASIASHPSNPLAPWQSSGWSSQRAQALQDLHDNKIPATYHDLVRDYFTRDNVDH
jgi:hypothetical protein